MNSATGLAGMDGKITSFSTTRVNGRVSAYAAGPDPA